jgi:hypothetical protein
MGHSPSAGERIGTIHDQQRSYLTADRTDSGCGATPVSSRTDIRLLLSGRIAAGAQCLIRRS